MGLLLFGAHYLHLAGTSEAAFHFVSLAELLAYLS